MNKVLFTVLPLMVILAVGCTEGREETPAVEFPLVFTPTPISTPTEEPTHLPPTVATPFVAMSPQSSPTATTQVPETLDPERIPTYTPSSEIICPPSVHTEALSLPAIFESPFGAPAERTVEYLNSGGSIEQVRRAFEELNYPSVVEWQDLTNNGVPELILRLFYFEVYQCDQGQYVKTLYVCPSAINSPPRAYIKDLNGNGIPELVVTTMFLGAHDGTLSMQIFEWDGQDFANRLPEKIDHPFGDRAIAYIEHEAVHMYNGTVHFSDVDNNGTIEIQLNGGGNDLYEDTLWMWNGEVFALVDATQ